MPIEEQSQHREQIEQLKRLGDFISDFNQVSHIKKPLESASPNVAVLMEALDQGATVVERVHDEDFDKDINDHLLNAHQRGCTILPCGGYKFFITRPNNDPKLLASIDKNALVNSKAGIMRPQTKQKPPDHFLKKIFKGVK